MVYLAIFLDQYIAYTIFFSYAPLRNCSVKTVNHHYAGLYSRLFQNKNRSKSYHTPVNHGHVTFRPPIYAFLFFTANIG